MSDWDSKKSLEKIEISDVFFGGITQYSPYSLTPPGGNLTSLSEIDEDYVEFECVQTDEELKPIENMNFTEGMDGWYFYQTLGSTGISFGYEGSGTHEITNDVEECILLKDITAESDPDTGASGTEDWTSEVTDDDITGTYVEIYNYDEEEKDYACTVYLEVDPAEYTIIKLRIGVGLVEESPYPWRIYIYKNNANQIEQSTYIDPPDIVSEDVGSCVEVDISNIAHTLDGEGFIKLRIVSRLGEEYSGKKLGIGEIEFEHIHFGTGSIYLNFYGANLGPYWMNYTYYFPYSSGVPLEASLTWSWMVKKCERVANADMYVVMVLPNATRRTIAGPIDLTTLYLGDWYFNKTQLDVGIFSSSGTYSLVLAILGQTMPGGGNPGELHVLYDDVGISISLSRIYSTDFQGTFTIEEDPSTVRSFMLWYTGHYNSSPLAPTKYNPTFVDAFGGTSFVSGDHQDLAYKDGSFLTLRSNGTSTRSNPSTFTVLGNTTHESGNLENLASDDSTYMSFRSYSSNFTMGQGSRSWWNSSYLYRRKLVITNNNPANPVPAKFTISFPINTQQMVSEGKLQDDGDDFRIVWWDSSSSSWLELDRLNTTNFNTAATTISVRTQGSIAGGSSNDEYYIYYGNSGATNPPTNGSNVYFFEDLFNRQYSSTVGFGWVEYETGIADARIASNTLVETNVLDLYSQDQVMDTIAQHSLFGLTNRSVWEFGFAWDRGTREGHYEVYMQLGDSSMNPSSPWTGVSVFVSWSGTGTSTTIGVGASEQEMMRVFDNDQTPTEIEVVSGGADIKLDMDLTEGDFKFYRDEVYKGTCNVYQKLSAYDAIRFVADRLGSQNIVKRGIDYTRIYLAMDPDPSVNIFSEENVIDWWDTNYKYRRIVNVTAGSAAIPSGYTAPVTINHAELVSSGKSLANGNDIRVLYWTGTSWSELDRDLINVGSASTRVCFKTQAAISAGDSDNNYFVYYGNQGAGSPPSDRNNVYDFWDDFDDGSLDPAWTFSQIGGASGSVSEFGSVVRLEATNSGDLWDASDSILFLSILRSDDVIVESYTSDWGGSLQSLSKMGGVQLRQDLDAASKNRVMSPVYSAVGATNSYRLLTGGGTSEETTSTQTRYCRLSRLAGTSRAWYSTDGASWAELGSPISFNGGLSDPIRLGFHLAGLSSSTHWVEIDWFKVRKYVDPEPSTSLGEEEVMAVYVVEVEFAGTSDMYLSEWLSWAVDSAWTTDLVSVTLQLYNFSAGQYSAGGDGYIGYTSGVEYTDEKGTQHVTTNPSDFRNATGGWRIKIRGEKETTSPFELQCDWIEFKADAYEICDWYVQFTGDYSHLEQIDVSYWGYYDEDSVIQTMYIYNWITETYDPLGSSDTYAVSGVGQWQNRTLHSALGAYSNSSNIRIRILAERDVVDQFDCYADYLCLKVYWPSSASTVTQQIYIKNMDEDTWQLLRTSNIGASDETQGPIEIEEDVDEYIGPLRNVKIRVRGDSDYPITCQANYMSIRAYYKDYSTITLSVDNTGSETVKLVALWIINSTIHSRITLEPGVNADYVVLSPGQSLVFQADYPYSISQYMFKMVTQRGTVAHYVKTAD